jgi:double-stranded uracil-DNA glycosylase
MAAPRAIASVGFAPVARADAQVLVLGSLPGQMSLAQQQYYAQPRNAFWKIAGELCGFDPSLDYEARLRALMAHRIALWDTCAAAVRPGSLDARIVRASVVPNDFAPFLQAHPRIRRLCFNGATAAALFERLVLPSLPESLRGLPRLRLPSTSPAHAGMSHARKLEAWRAVLEPDTND